MKLYLDTNVILDLILQRFPFFDDIARIVTLSEKGECSLYTSSVSFVNCNYILGKNIEKKRVLENLKILSTFCTILAVGENEINKSLVSNFDDFEDAVQYFTSLKKNCDYIITRDKYDFKNAQIPVMSPTEFIASINKN